jgi:hypothetical protein
MRQADIHVLVDTGMAEQNFREIDGRPRNQGSIPAGRREIYLFHKVQAGSEAHPVAYTMGTGDVSRGVQRPGREADYSPPSSAEVKNVAAIPPLPHMSSSYDA